ncbi:MAG: hypothetical protein PHH26_00110 [Candidatus Thermoplasmatota archaeon]|nr:hypothetical protein [Candidatus Thermoplasmatota archaeon]
MKAVFAVLAVGLMVAAAFGGCIGGKAPVKEQSIPTEEGNKTVDFSTIMKQAPTDVTDGVAHWRIDGAAAFQFNYDQTGALPPATLEQFTYDLKLPNGTVAIEVLCDWESANMDLDMYFLKGGKDTGLCQPNYMVNDPMVVALGDQGATWEYFNAIQNKTKKFSIPTDYQIRVDVFNNWEPTAAAGTPTPFTLDVWVYTAAPEKWHPHQELGQ